MAATPGRFLSWQDHLFNPTNEWEDRGGAMLTPEYQAVFWPKMGFLVSLDDSHRDICVAAMIVRLM